MLVTKEADMGTKRQKGKASEVGAQPTEGSELPERWSAARKCELVMRLLRASGKTIVVFNARRELPRARAAEALRRA